MGKVNTAYCRFGIWLQCVGGLKNLLTNLFIERSLFCVVYNKKHFRSVDQLGSEVKIFEFLIVN